MRFMKCAKEFKSQEKIVLALKACYFFLPFLLPSSLPPSFLTLGSFTPSKQIYPLSTKCQVFCNAQN